MRQSNMTKDSQIFIYTKHKAPKSFNVLLKEHKLYHLTNIEAIALKHHKNGEKTIKFSNSKLKGFRIWKDIGEIDGATTNSN